MDDDVLNMTGNSTEEFTRESDMYERLFVELLSLVGVLSLGANALVVFTTLKYQKLRQETSYILLVHLNVLQAIVLLLIPLAYRLILEFSFLMEIHRVTMCVVFEACAVLTSASFMIAVLLITDGYLKLFHRSFYGKLSCFTKYFLGAVYLIALCLFSVSFDGCSRRTLVPYSFFAMVALFLFLFFYLIVMNIVHLIRRRHLSSTNTQNVGLAVTNTFFLLWFPCLIVLFTYRYYAPLTITLLFVLGFSSPIFNLFYLYYYEGDYNLFIKQVVSCKCNVYKNEALVDETINYSDRNGVRIHVA